MLPQRPASVEACNGRVPHADCLLREALDHSCSQVVARCSLADEELSQAKKVSRNHLDDLKVHTTELWFP